MEIIYYQQQTPFTCSLAVLRMSLSIFGRETSEIELAKVIGFKPSVGVSMPMLAKACEIMNFDYELLKNADIDDIKNLLSKNLYPIVIVKARIYEKVTGEHGHFLVVKDIKDKNIIVNDPDREHGGENKPVDVDVFKKAWNASNSWLLGIKGEME